MKATGVIKIVPFEKNGGKCISLQPQQDPIIYHTLQLDINTCSTKISIQKMLCLNMF